MEKLRFKDDNGNNYPEWSVCKLNSIAKTYDGTHQTPKYTEFGIPFLSVTNLTQNNFKNTKFIAEEVYNKEKTKIEVGNILMTKIGDIGTTKHIDEEIKASYYVSLALIKVNDNINSKYLNYALNSPTFKVNLKNRSLLNAFPQKINLGEIGKCNIPLSNNIQEQVKIANYFSNLDKLIYNTQRELELVEKYKKDMLHKIFNQKIRFKDDNGNDYPEWKLTKLDKICNKIYQPQTISKSELIENGEFNVYGANGIIGKYNKYNHEDEQVLISCRGEKCGIINYSQQKSWINGNSIVIDIKKEHNKKYFYYILQNYNFDKIITGSAQPQITREPIKNLNINIPCFEEQNKIANLFSGIDSEILNLKNSLKSMSDLKKDMLEKMF